MNLLRKNLFKKIFLKRPYITIRQININKYVNI